MMSTKYFAYMVYILYPHESDFKKLGAAGWHAPSLKIIFSVESLLTIIYCISIFLNQAQAGCMPGFLESLSMRECMHVCTPPRP